MSNEGVWLRRVGLFERSGLTRRDWCERAGVAVSSLDYWRRRLRLRSALVPVVVRDEVAYAKGRVGASARVRGDSSAKSLAQIGADRHNTLGASIEVVFGDVRLRVSHDVDAAWLCLVLRGLR